MLFNFNLFQKQKGTGALLDERTQDEKLKDYRFEEIVAKADPVNWVEKSQSQWRKFPIYDQNGSSQCVAASLSKLLSIQHYIKEGEWVDFSAGFIYWHRKNKPAEGMWATDAWDIVRNKGVLIEQLFPWQKKKDKDIDSYQIKQYEYDIAKIFTIKNYVALPIRDIDTVASVIQKTGKAVMVWYYFKYDEWARNVPQVFYPNLSLYGSESLKHSVVAVDYTLYNGKKALIIDDSWGAGNSTINGQRVITEDFHTQRNYYAGYALDFNFETGLEEKPKWTFTKDLSWGMKNDKDVEMLQRCLAYLKLFPNEGYFTGNFYGLTLDAVKKFQAQYGIQNTGYVGELTRQKLNELFS